MSGRCTGQCCEEFIMSFSIEDMQYRSTKEDVLGPEAVAENNQILDMVIYLGFYRAKIGGGYGYHYTCRHFDKQSRNCTIYETRPAMCRRYPNGKPCPFPGCTLTPDLRPDVVVEKLTYKVGRKKEIANG